MRLRWFGVGCLGVALSLGAVAPAFAQPANETPAEKHRRELREKLGVKASPKAPETSPSDSAPESGSPDAAGEAAATGTTTAGASSAPLPNFVDDVRPVLKKKCASCHASGKPGGMSKLVFGGDARREYELTMRFVHRANAAQSPLLQKASASGPHMGGKVLAVGSGGYAAIVRWIRAGAKFGPEAVPVRAPVAGSSRPATTRPKRADATSSVPSVAPTDAAEGAPSEPSPGAEASPSTPASPPAVPPYYVAFVPRVHDALMKACASCHSTTGFAAKSKYLTDADPGKHFSSARALVAPGSAESSTLYIRAHGEGHPAGAVWAKGSAELALLAQWINEGAHDVAAPVVASAGTGEPPAAGAVDAVSRASVAPAGAETGASDQGANPHAGISLGTHPFVGALTLNGRFDLNYERRDYNDNPFAGSANHVLRSYHHFLFLTRESADDPIHITLEMLTLQFWEVGARLSPGAWPVRVSAKFGKVLVPFGSEPLFHHSYGGLAGFDQRVLPPVFAREGIKFNAEGKLGEVALSADLYAIAGYGLKAADGVLNLQSDFAPLEDTRLGFGARLGGSWGALSGWYSLYYNRLGYDRALVLQALDFAVWRPHGVPVFEDFSLELGALRADVSGGGPGLDYYHFATYFQVRYYPLAWLYLQYRQGIFTFNNRRGLIVDESDLTNLDSSSHNVGIVARYRGFSVGLFQFWNFERADEIPNDFTRLMVAYDF